MKKIIGLFVLLFIVGTQIVNAQKQVTGTVTSAEDGLAMPGVSVVIKGTTVGSSTDIEGNYSLQANSSDVLMFSFVGMVTQEIAVGDQTVINVVMETESIGMDEVVVTALGVTREKKALGYSVQEVGGDDLVKTKNTNVVNSIGGRIAGVQVTSSSGAAGGSSFITIRGAASLTGNNQPLFVVDGVPINNDQEADGNPDDGTNNFLDGTALSNRAIDLNPEDISSMSVLKGGAATALYGLRAANGAIIITTKKGTATKGKRVDVSFSSSATWDRISQLPKLQKTYAQGVDGEWSEGYFATWGPKISDSEYDGVATTYNPNGSIVPAGTGNGITPFVYDQFDFFETGLTLNNSISVSGGNEDATFYVSASNSDADGVIPKNTFERNTVKIAGEANLSEKFTISGSANYIKSGGKRIQQGSNTSGVMLGLMRTPPTFDNAYGYELEDGAQRNYRNGGGYDNPYWTVNKNQTEDEVNRIIGHVGLVYNPFDWMSVTYRLGTDFYQDRRHAFYERGSRTFPTGLVSENHITNRDVNSDLLVNMNHTFSDDLNATLTLGQNLYQSKNQQLYVQSQSLAQPGFYHISNGSSQLMRENQTEKRTSAYFYDVNFAYKNMLFLGTTGRYEQSTTLSKDDNAFFYPSVSAGFIFSELPALQGNSILSFGKLRSSYAIVANDAPAYRTKNYYTNIAVADGWTDGIFFPFDGVGAFQNYFILGSDNLKPEKTKSFEIGVDLRFFNNRLGVDFAYYNNKHEDLLLGVRIARSTGFQQKFTNAGEMENKGIELLVSGTPVKTSNFEWNVLVNFTKNENKVIKLAENVENVFLGGFESPSVRAVAGEPYGSVYGGDWERDANGNILIEDDPDASNYGFPTISGETISYGTVQPDWIMGITNEMSYKGFNLSFLIDIKRGGKMWNGTRGALNFFGTHADTESREDLVVMEGVKRTSGAVNDIQVTKGQNWFFDGEGSGFTGPEIDYIEDTDWVRLKEVTLSYDLNPDWIKDTFIRSLNVYFSGRNLWLDTPYKGVDPETSLTGSNNSQGFDYFNMPGTKSYTIGLRASF